MIVLQEVGETKLQRANSFTRCWEEGGVSEKIKVKKKKKNSNEHASPYDLQFINKLD